MTSTTRSDFSVTYRTCGDTPDEIIIAQAGTHRMRKVARPLAAAAFVVSCMIALTIAAGGSIIDIIAVGPAVSHLCDFLETIASRTR